MGLDVRKPFFEVWEQKRRRPHRLISTFVICFLESIVSKLATGEISIFQLVSVAMETGLSLALPETLKTGFVTSRPIYKGMKYF